MLWHVAPSAAHHCTVLELLELPQSPSEASPFTKLPSWNAFGQQTGINKIRPYKKKLGDIQNSRAAGRAELECVLFEFLLKSELKL